MGRKNLVVIEIGANDAKYLDAVASERGCTIDEAAAWVIAAAAQIPVLPQGNDVNVRTRRQIAENCIARVRKALNAYFILLYEQSDQGDLYNVDSDDRIRIATPWSRTVHGSYGLTDPESRVLHSLVVRRLEQQMAEDRLFRLNRGQWYLNRSKFPDIGSAEQWAQSVDLSPATWLELWDERSRQYRKRYQYSL